jgi:DNA repair protein RecO (recombination protein O)
VLTKDRAVCIRAADYSETSQVVTLFARLSGKVRAIAKGSKRPKSAFEGPIEVLSFGDVVFSDAHKDRLSTLTEFQAQPACGGLRKNLFALHSALFAVELLDSMTDDYDPHLELFDHFARFVQDIEQGTVGPNRRDILLRLVLLQLVLLHEVGLRPVLHACANCRRPFGADWRESYFSASAHGLICRDCEMNYADKVRLSVEASGCLADVKRLADADESTLNEIEQVLVRHFTEILGRQPRTAKYLQGERT